MCIKCPSNDSELSGKLKTKPCNDYYRGLVKEAPYIPGDDGDIFTLEDIEWADKSLLKDGYNFHVKHYTAVVLSTCAALVLGFAVKPLTSVLLRTGKLYDPELSFQRYLSTIQRFTKFFLLPLDPEKGYKTFQTVRRLHRNAVHKRKLNKKNLRRVSNDIPASYKTEMAKAMRKDLAFMDTSSAPKRILTWDPKIPVSQFDMVITQLGLVGTIWLFPKLFGIKDRDELKGYMHTWAIFGKLLGIQDKYNICIDPDPKAIEKVFRNIVIESLKTMDHTVVTIQHAFMESLNRRVPFVTYKGFIFFGLTQFEEYEGKHLWQIMTWKDKVSYRFLQIFMWTMRSSIVVRWLCHGLVGIFYQFQYSRNMPTEKILGFRDLIKIVFHGISSK